MRALCTLLFALSGLSLAGCASSSRGFWPSGQEWRDSAVEAAQSPASWAPALGAAIVVAADADHRLSDSAREDPRLFDDGDDAQEFGDRGQNALGLLALGTAWYTGSVEPDGAGNGPLRRTGALILAHGTAAGVGEGLKSAVGRERPDDSGDRSFPSGHATQAFSYAGIAARNLEDAGASTGARWAWNIGLYTTASAVAWSRVEAGKHHPSDVLAGAALGSFVGQWLYGAFLDRPEPGTALSVVPVDEGAMVFVQTRF
ncbi:MAG: phosphatase PAP2 family protein [Gammaproteobacteria bacterium]|nr:phosphatase PAP2 family protein [Gammaproteobacteria bacterium]